ncbi:hypothetical protein [Ornithinimicrobium kibberense]|uniref:hypothetical protein n=1 Tax=Ornithinimicrobium kibberense TaxID=282060 RepID=UPI00360BDFD1
MPATRYSDRSRTASTSRRPSATSSTAARPPTTSSSPSTNWRSSSRAKSPWRWPVPRRRCSTTLTRTSRTV